MKPKKAWFCRSAIGLAWICCASAQNRQFFEQIDLFHQGDAGIHTYRIPALVQTKKGVLIAVVDARHDSTKDLPARISLVMRRSSDGGRTWSAARTIVNPTDGGVGDASLLLDRKTGRVWCFHAYGAPGIGFDTSRAGRDTLQVHAMYTDDDGGTWSNPRDLTPQIKDPSWQGMFATSGTNIQTSTGRLIVPLVVRDGLGEVSARNAYSDDGGQTWKTGAAIGAGTNESHAVELRDGTILQNMRDETKRKGTRAIARSSDGGVTFGPLEFDAALIDPACNAGIARRVRGRQDLILFTNAASTTRKNLTVRISFDEGRTWPEARVIHAGSAAYSTVIPLKDGLIGVLYERGERFPAEKITFARFNLAWVTGKK